MFDGTNINASPLGGALAHSLGEAGLAGSSLGDAPESCSVPPGITIACTGGGQVDCPGAKFYRLFLSWKTQNVPGSTSLCSHSVADDTSADRYFVLQSLLSKITTKLQFQSLINRDTILYDRANEETSTRRREIASRTVTDIRPHGQVTVLN